MSHQIIKLTNLFILSLCFTPINLFVRANPEISQQSICQTTVNEVIEEIKNKGVNDVIFTVYQNTEIEENNPTNRSDTLRILLGTLETGQFEEYKIEAILSSAILMNTWANKIVKNCSNTAVVVFGRNNSGWLLEYAIQKDGTTKLRECADMENENLDWNQQYCM